ERPVGAMVIKPGRVSFAVTAADRARWRRATALIGYKIVVGALEGQSQAKGVLDYLGILSSNPGPPCRVGARVTPSSGPCPSWLSSTPGTGKFQPSSRESDTDASDGLVDLAGWKWQDSDKTIRVTFSDGKVAAKAQSGL